MLVHALLVLVLSGGVEGGELALRRAEQRVYRWPSTVARIGFEARTDALAPLLSKLKAELKAAPDEETSRLVEALEHAKLSGVVDARTGKLESTVTIDFHTDDRYTRVILENAKKQLTGTLLGCFQALAAHDPARWRTSGAVIDADAQSVTLRGHAPSERVVLQWDGVSGLPSSIEQEPGPRLDLSYEPVAPGQFVPATIEWQTGRGPRAHTDFRWKRTGGIWFPDQAHVNGPGPVAAHALTTIEFDHVTVESAAR